LALLVARREGIRPQEARAALGELSVTLTLPLGEASQELLEESASQLARELEGRIAEMLRAAHAFRQGRVYCFLCESSECRHATPEQRDQSFCGYTHTGRPVWESFVNLCLKRGEERVDRLYSDRPEVIAIAQQGSELKRGLLPGFGRDSVVFNVLGQVVMGLLPADLREGSAAPRIALTVQLVETHFGKRSFRLRVNLIGLSLDAIIDAAADAESRGPAERLRRLIRSTESKLGELARAVIRRERGGEPTLLGEKSAALVNGLRGELERVFRPLQRRTKHAETRHQSGQRPTSDAMRDATMASSEQVLFDERKNTFVVLGPRSRAHVFSAEGKLVTSLRLEPGEVERKLEQRRWSRSSAGAWTAVRSRILD
jgi:hypothetical protein